MKNWSQGFLTCFSRFELTPFLTTLVDFYRLIFITIAFSMNEEGRVLHVSSLTSYLWFTVDINGVSLCPYRAGGVLQGADE